MSSNYWTAQPSTAVREDELEGQVEVRCSRCHGTGLVEVYDQETDCIDCEGYGTVFI